MLASGADISQARPSWTGGFSRTGAPQRGARRGAGVRVFYCGGSGGSVPAGQVQMGMGKVEHRHKICRKLAGCGEDARRTLSLKPMTGLCGDLPRALRTRVGVSRREPVRRGDILSPCSVAGNGRTACPPSSRRRIPSQSMASGTRRTAIPTVGGKPRWRKRRQAVRTISKVGPLPFGGKLGRWGQPPEWTGQAPPPPPACPGQSRDQLSIPRGREGFCRLLQEGGGFAFHRPRFLAACRT